MPPRKKETSKIILASAFKCISAKGCAAVTLRDIAEEAGVALSQLNYYYTNKEGLFSEVLRSMRENYVADIEQKMAKCPSPAEKIVFLIRHNRQLLRKNKALYRSFLDFFNLAMWSASFRKEMNQFLDDISSAIERQIGTAGSPAPADPEAPSPAALTTLILATTFGLAMQYLMSPEREELLAGFDLLESALR
jgi:AcrR family transcriptional regulator